MRLPNKEKKWTATSGQTAPGGSGRANDIEALFSLPFADLIFRAQTVHQENFSANEIQASSLVSIKTGACPEDCGYCNQSATFDTCLKASKLMDAGRVMAEARRAKSEGASRFCMGAVRRSPKDRDMLALCEMVVFKRSRACKASACLNPKQAPLF